LTAIPGDNKVTLYWDDVAETTFDRYIIRLAAMVMILRDTEFTGHQILLS